MLHRDPKTTRRPKMLRNTPQRPNKQRLKNGLQAARQAAPPLLFAAILFYLWQTATPVYVKTAFLTFIGTGTLLLVGKFFLKGVMEPLQEMQKTLGLVGSALLVYADGANGGATDDVQQEARRSLRALAGDLAAKRRAQGYYGVLAGLEILPTKESIQESVSDLILMSECVGTDNQTAFYLASERIEKALWLEL